MSQTQTQKVALQKANASSHERLCEDIRQALLSLMKKMSYDEIRTTDIIKAAGVSRSAFYRNYYLKSDVLNDIYSRINLEFSGNDPDEIYGNWERIFRHIEHNASFYQLLVKNGLTGMVLDRINQRELREDYNEYLLWNGMIYNICLDWIKGGMDKSPEDMMVTVKTALTSIAKKIAESD